MISRLTAFVSWKPLFWATVLGILVLSLLPSTTPMPTTGWDKTNHLLGFTTLTVLARLAYPAGRFWPKALGLLGFGVLIELLQSLTPTRSAGGADVVADGIGVAIGWGLALFRAHAGLAWQAVLCPDWRQLRHDLAAPLRWLGR